MLSLSDVVVGVLLAAATKLVVNGVVALRSSFRSISSCPGQHPIYVDPFREVSIITALFFPPRGWLSHYAQKFTVYASDGSTVLSSVVLWGARTMYWLADAEVLRIVTSDRHTFRKEVEAYGVLNIYGKSVLTTENDEWRRHLAIVGPSFNESLYALNWSETLRLVQEWFDELDNKSSSGKAIDLKSSMDQIALLIIASAGFGMRSPWTSASNMHAKVKANLLTDEPMPFHIALGTTLEKIFLKVLIPTFAYHLPFRVPWLSDQARVTTAAFDSLKGHMSDLVLSARSGGNDEENLLHRLVLANDAAQETEGSKKGTLTDDELFSNIFIFLVAGHETSSHALCFAIMMLAIYPEVQEKLRAEVNSIWPTEESFTNATFKGSFDKLEYALAVLRETLRCFPAEPRLTKIVEEDYVLPATRFELAKPPSTASTSFDGGPTNIQLSSSDEIVKTRFSVPVRKGDVVVMDIWALHMNPFVWGSDAHEFKPERFIDTDTYRWPRDGFLAFSAGPRGCLGQRFAHTSAVCILASIVRRYEILLPEDLSQIKDREELKRRLLKWTTGITLTPTNAFVRFKKLV